MNTANEQQAATAFQRAMALHQQGRLDEAAASYQQVLRLQPQNLTALNLVGVISLQKNDARAAIDLFDRALALDPQSATLHLSRGSAYAMLNEHEAAIACYEKAIALDPESNASPYYSKATALQLLKRYEAAVASYDQAIALQTDLDAEAYYGRATALLELKDFVGAIESFDKALALGASYSAEALYARGMALCELKQWDAALSSFDRVIVLEPARASAHFSRGVVLGTLQRWAAALQSLDRAIELAPDHAEALSYRAAALKELGRLEQALESCVRAVSLQPDHPQAHFYRGIVLAELGEWRAALVSIDRAIELEADYALAHFNRGLILRNHDREAALSSFGRALEYDRGLTKAYESLGSLLISMERGEQAATVYRRWLEVDPANPIAAHMYAAASGQNVPERCAVAYVISVFDYFASSFDAVLEGVGYAAPQLLSAALARKVDFGRGRLDILDAGCGTGLCGLLLRSTARVLTGVDLSSQMLSKARARNVYDELFEAELAAFMESRPERFDIVNCADTFIYIGALQQVIAAARRCLRPKGVFAFTVEALPEQSSVPFKLTLSGRYAHSVSFLQETMRSAGFSELECQAINLRKEGDAHVRGYLFLGSVAA